MSRTWHMVHGTQHFFKGGIGTSSRVVEVGGGRYMLGALVQANHGDRHLLRVDGVPVGREIGYDHTPSPWEERPAEGLAPSPGSGQALRAVEGSIIVVVVTDAPLIAAQCKRLARRAAVGLARVGSVAHNGSGDIFIALATGNHVYTDTKGLHALSMLPHSLLNPFFEAVAEAVEESILNALCAAETMTGYRGRTAQALPLDALQRAMALYGRREA